MALCSIHMDSGKLDVILEQDGKIMYCIPVLKYCHFLPGIYNQTLHSFLSQWENMGDLKNEKLIILVGKQRMHQVQLSFH